MTVERSFVVPNAGDIEIQAIAIIKEVLYELDKDAQKRILRYFESRCKIQELGGEGESRN